MPLARGLPLVLSSGLVLAALTTTGMAQSTAQPVQDTSLVEQIAPDPDTALSIDKANCPEDTENEDAPCPDQGLLLNDHGTRTEAPVVLREDGAYLRLGTPETADTTETDDTLLDLNPLTQSE